MNDIRKDLERLRGKKTQKDVVEMTGLNITTISRVENGLQDITTERLEKWLNSLGYTLTYRPL